MRLIDADKLDAEMYHKSFEVDDGRNVWNSGLWIRYKIFEETLRDAPTIDDVPARHGRWIWNDYGGFGNYHCSECRKICICNGDYDYCPNCGARMDDETD